MDNPDINGRIESFDQSVRSLDRRLRAVERRLSASKDEIGLTTYENADADQWIDPDIQELRSGLQEFRDIIEDLMKEVTAIKSNDLTHVEESVNTLQQEVQAATHKIEEVAKQQTFIKEDASASVDSLSSTYKSEIAVLREELETAKQRIQRQQNMNKITIGSIKVPIELSGIVASIALFITGYLVWVDRWDIIRSAYYPTGLAMLFAAAVVVKFVMTNRQPDTS